MYVNSFDILELQDWRSFNLDITKKHIDVDLIYYVYSERFVKQSFLYGELHVNLYHIWSYRIRRSFNLNITKKHCSSSLVATASPSSSTLITVTLPSCSTLVTIVPSFSYSTPTLATFLDILFIPN